jgi:hypothetical protein
MLLRETKDVMPWLWLPAVGPFRLLLPFPAAEEHLQPPQPTCQCQSPDSDASRQAKGRGQGCVVPWIRSVRGLNGRIWLPSPGRPARSRAPAAAPTRHPPLTQPRRRQLLGGGSNLQVGERGPLACASSGGQGRTWGRGWCGDAVVSMLEGGTSVRMPS